MNTIVKTEGMLNAFDPNALALIKSCGIAFCGAQDEADEAVTTYQRLLGLTPSWDCFEMARITWLEGIVEDVESKGRTISQDALNHRWADFIKKVGISKPKKMDNADSVKKAEKRAEQKAKEEAMFANMTMDDLTAKVDELLKKHTKANLKEAGKYQDRIEKLRKEENKEEEAQKAQLVKDLTAWAKDQSYLELYTLCENLGVI
jgi:ribosomal protein S16